MTDHNSPLIEVAKEISKQIDRCMSNVDGCSAANLSQLFSDPVIMYQEKLKSICEILLFKEPLKYGTFAEDSIRHKVFCDTIKLCRKHIDSMSPDAMRQYRTHLAVAFSFYHSIISKMCKRIPNFKFDPYFHSDINDPTNETVCEEEESAYFKRAIQKSVLNLGDIARYQHEIDSNVDKTIAYRAYRCALLMRQESGVALHQIGTLYNNTNNGFDSSYYYLACLSCAEPFMAARSNLEAIISSQLGKNDPVEGRFLLFQRMIKLIHLIMFQSNVSGKQISIDLENVPALFDQCLDEDDDFSDYCEQCSLNNCSRLHVDHVFKVLGIVLILVDFGEKQLKQSELMDEEKFQALFALALSLINVLMERCCQSYNSNLSILTTSQMSNHTKPIEFVSHKPKRKPAKLLDLGYLNLDLMNETSPPGFEDEIQSAIQLALNLANFNIETDVDEEGEDHTKSIADHLSTECVTYVPLLAVLRVGFEWLASKRHYLNLLSSLSSPMFWSQLCEMLNTLPDEECMIRSGLCEQKFLLSLLQNRDLLSHSNWNKIPLTEDLEMCFFEPIFKHKYNIRLDVINELSVAEEAVLRLISMRRFGYLVAGVISRRRSCASFKYDLTLKQFTFNDNQCSDSVGFFPIWLFSQFNQFFLKKVTFIVSLEKIQIEIKALESNVNHLISNNNVNKNQSSSVRLNRLEQSMLLAKMRLREELKAMKRVIVEGQCVVVQYSVFVDDFRVLDQLIRSKQYVLFIPNNVIMEIDRLKRDSQAARRAGRWIQHNLTKEPSYVIVHIMDEDAKGENFDYETEEEYNLIQMLNCCKILLRADRGGGISVRRELSDKLKNVHIKGPICLLVKQPDKENRLEEMNDFVRCTLLGDDLQQVVKVCTCQSLLEELAVRITS